MRGAESKSHILWTNIDPPLKKMFGFFSLPRNKWLPALFSKKIILSRLKMSSDLFFLEYFRNILFQNIFYKFWIYLETKKMCFGKNISKWFYAFWISYSTFCLRNLYSENTFCLWNFYSRIIKDNSGISKYVRVQEEKCGNEEEIPKIFGYLFFVVQYESIHVWF